MSDTILAIGACSALGGLAGYATSAVFARPTGRRRGAHRRWWQRNAPPGEAPTQRLPVIRD